ACQLFDGRIAVFTPGADRMLFPPLDHGSSVEALLFSPDGRLLVSAGGGGGKRSILKVWDAAGKQGGKSIEGAQEARAMAFHPPSGALMTAGFDGRVRLWNPTTGAQVGLVLEHGVVLSALAVSPDGKQVVGAGGGARVWTLTPIEGNRFRVTTF